MYLPLWKGDRLYKRYFSIKRARVILVLQLNITLIISAFGMETLLSDTMSATPTKTAVASRPSPLKLSIDIQKLIKIDKNN